MSRFTRWSVVLGAGVCLFLMISTAPVAAEDVSPQLGKIIDVSPQLAGFLQKGELAAAEKAFTDQLGKTPDAHQTRFALGIIKVLSALEHLSQDQFRYGFISGKIRTVPAFRMPVPVNPKAEPITYQQARQIFVDLQKRLIAAEAELAKVDTSADVKLSANLLGVRMDLDGNGKAEDGEDFSQIFGVVNRRRPDVPAPEFQVKFDSGDVPWLRGYCHFLCAFCDVVLAYDHQRMFDHAAHWIYPKAVPSKTIGKEPLNAPGQPTSMEWDIVDAVSAIHLMDFPVVEPQRMASARQHLLAMIQTSRESWKLILAETDDDQEWLPGPKQTGVLQIPVTQDFIDGWHGVLVEMEEVLEGRKLVPFWRDYQRFIDRSGDTPEQGRGVNLKRFFDEPTDFDLILIIQGTGVLPYLEHGDLSHPDTWENLTRVFQGQFFGFALWFN
jgi:hypothetical protein